MNYIIIITGATAVGKTSFSIQLAEKIGGEIINADIGSFYKPLTIGTAKPDWSDDAIPHHLFDYIDKPRDETVVAFREQVQELCAKIWARGKTPIIVGGSTLYIKSLLYRQAHIPQLDQDEAMQIESMSRVDLYQELLLIDPVRATQIDPQDRYRLERAISIWRATGKQPSSFQVAFDPIAPFCFIEMIQDRKNLYERINQRVEQMFIKGWMQEVETLSGTDWEPFLMRKKMMGYDRLLEIVKKNNDLDLETIKDIQKSIRNYAKRQITFYKKLKKELADQIQQKNEIGFIRECSLTLSDLSLYIKQLSVDLYKNFLS